MVAIKLVHKHSWPQAREITIEQSSWTIPAGFPAIQASCQVMPKSTTCAGLVGRFHQSSKPGCDSAFAFRHKTPTDCAGIICSHARDWTYRLSMICQKAARIGIVCQRGLRHGRGAQGIHSCTSLLLNTQPGVGQDAGRLLGCRAFSTRSPPDYVSSTKESALSSSLAPGHHADHGQFD